MSLTVKGLADYNRNELIQAWAETFGSSPAPNTSQDMMRLIIGWELQAKSARSDVRTLKAEVKKLLKSRSASHTHVAIAKPKIDLSPGTRLSRNWQGRTYIVDVLDKGYAFDGKLFSSLTPIAKAITGSHRSGPQFFGVSR